MKYYKGSFRTEQTERNGWIIGRFMDGIRRNEFVAVKSWSYKKGQNTSSHSRKYEREATEITFIISGMVRALLDGEKIVLESGDYVIIPPKVISNLVFEILEDTEALTIKSPSLSKDDSVKLPD
jgi:quercetin dioxygenase-like cupin family protein